MAGQQQQRGVHQHLVPGEDPPLLALRQHGDEIVARIDDAPVDQRRDILDHPPHAFGERLHPVILAASDVQQLFRKLPDVGPVLARNAHHLRDHQDRQRRRQVPHHVHAALFLGRIEQLLHGGLDKRAPGFHRLRREVAMHHPAHLQMLGAIVLDELAALVVLDVLVETQVRLIDRGIGRPRVVLEHRGREQLVVPGEPDEIVVTGNHPQRHTSRSNEPDLRSRSRP